MDQPDTFAESCDDRRGDCVPALVDTTYDADFGRFLAHSGWLTALARELVREPALADDVVQDTWVAALRARRERVTSERGWLATLLANAVRSRARSESARGAREKSVASSEAVDGPDRLVERAEAQRTLLAHVLALRDPYRGTLLERYVEERSCAEIARRAGIAESTVRTRLSRAQAQLRERLERADPRRATWALAPLLDGARAPSGTGAALMTWTGVAIVSTMTKCALAVAVAALAWWLWPSGATNPVELADRARSDAPAIVAAPDVGAQPALESAPERRNVTPDETPPEPRATTHVDPGPPPIALPPSVLEVAFRDGERPVPGVGVWTARAERWPIQYCLELAVRVPEDALHELAPASGVLRFADLRPGKYRLGFDASREPRAPTRFVTGDVTTGRRIEIVLGTGVVRGRVVDAQGYARAGAGVQVYEADRGADEFYVAAHAATDEAGRYAIDALAAGSYFVILDVDGDFEGRGETERRRIELARGEDRTVDFGGRASGVTWTGRVLNAFGEPFAGMSSVYFTDERTGASVTAETDLEGRFARTIPRGTWSVRARTTGAPNDGFGFGEFVLDREDVVRDLVVGGTRLQGYVTHDFDAEPSGERRELYVRAWPKAHGQHFARDAFVLFPDGRYQIDGLEPGTWIVSAYLLDPAHVDPIEVVIEPGQKVVTRDLRTKPR